MRSYLFFFVLLFFISGCVQLPFLEKQPKEEQGKGGAFTGLLLGKGVQVGFVPNNPPLNRIDGSFGVSLQFFNYNLQPITIDSFTLGSTKQYEGFTDFVDQSLTIEGARVRETQQGFTFLGPGTDYSYQGSGSRLRDGSIHFGTFQFMNVGAGASTQFYVDMFINEYPSVSLFQICAFDMVASDTLKSYGCPPTETLSGSRLGFGAQYDPVAVTKITKTLTSGTDFVTIRLDISIEDKSSAKLTAVGKGLEMGEILKKDGEQEFTFEVEPVSGGGVSLQCTSDQQRFDRKAGSFLTLVLREGKAQARCVGRDTLFEERRDYQYRITLRYPYHQYLSTSTIPIGSFVGDDF